MVDVNRCWECIALHAHVVRLVLAQLPIEEIYRTDEISDKAGRGKFIDLPWRADLNDLAMVHDADTRCQRHGLLLVVRHDDEGDAEAAPGY